MPGYRCILGCEQTGEVLHVFPNPTKFPERFKVWVNIVGGKLETPSDYEYFKKKRMCDIHFKEEHKNRNNRLSALAVPCLYLPGGALNPHSTDNLTTKQVVTTPLVTADKSLQSYGVKETAGSSAAPDEPISLLSTAIIETAPSSVAPCTSDVKLVPSVWKEHNYSMISRPERKRPTKDVLLSHQAKENRRQIKLLQSNICRLRKKSSTLKQSLASAVKLSNDAAFQRLADYVKEPAQLFMNMQKQANKKPKGRRFTIKEKVLCLSLYKKSAKCYRLLSSYFTLPSSRSMKRLLSRIKIKEGINKVIFEKIKESLRDEDVPNRLCTLMFDEMSITPQIFYDSNNDKFSGFASNRETAFADHALVFMVKGVQRNFKQPVAYYFTNGLKKIELKNIIKSVIKEVMRAGLIIVATVCDQSAVNTGAIKELVEETKANYLRRKQTWKEDVISINGHEIIPLYDTPHLFKGIRNNILDKDLVYISKNEKKNC